MSDGLDGGPEQGPVVESQQMGETRRAVIAVLSEPDAVYERQKNQDLKESWIDFAKQQLEKPVLNGQEKLTVASVRDASLGDQEQRGFVSSYLSHMGSEVDVANLKDIVSGKVPLITIDEAQLNNPDGPKIFWLEDANGRKKLFLRTKLDGVILELDNNGIGEGPETTGLTHPIIHISSK